MRPPTGPVADIQSIQKKADAEAAAAPAEQGVLDLTPIDPEFSTRESNTKTAVDPEFAKSIPADGAVRFQAGQLLGGRYEVRAHLGQGGMGQVWHAYDKKLQVDVALKFLHANLYADPRSLEALRREVRAARGVLSSNVCRIFDLVEIEGHEVVSMEYVDGQTLRQLLGERGALELTEAVGISTQFLAGLSAIHLTGLIHRDIKPANIMVTRTGRVVVMDFGLADKISETESGKVTGTPAYMSPEQAHAQPLDARSDIYSAGITLAEMIGFPESDDQGTQRQTFFAGLRENPPLVPEGPWKAVLLKALNPRREERHESANALARALEEVTLRAERDEGRSPYPGLAAFTEEETEFFFGREAEIESLWRKIERHEMLALIGPSGVGKSSFLRAGLARARPSGWGVAICKPGNDPGALLLRSLWQEFDTFPTLPPSGLPSLHLLETWKSRHREVLLIIDHFEELFTQNNAQTQRLFTDYLERAAREAGVHVLLSFRDDFLFHCSAHPSLAPIFANLTPFGTLTGESLRRALVQPAQRCGYRFEDEELIDEMLAEVRQERGALPLLAFAASRLWEQRDRASGLLTRAAYRRIEGVAGALAQHAESTLQKIGLEHEPLVREIFSNLVTAQGTRTSLNLDSLLSVFGPQRSTAERILATLVDARLLIVYEDSLSSGVQQVQIIHESLLQAWPRLVRWQAQDAESSILRDLLRQAAGVWDARGRPDEMLWSGGTFREFQLWRERYRGRLSSVEESFSSAMIEQEASRTRQAGVVFGLVIAVLLIVLGAMTYLYRGSEAARMKAEAARLLVIGKLNLETNPSAALAYSLASLRWSDDPLTRRFSIEALQQGPTAQVFDTSATSAWGIDFSPDGKWLASGMQDTTIWAWPRDGSLPKILRGHRERARKVEYTKDGKYLVSVGRDHTLRLWSMPDGVLARTVELGDLSWFSLHPTLPQAILLTHGKGLLVRRLTIPGGALEAVASYPMHAGAFQSAIEPGGRWMVVSIANRLQRLELEGPSQGQWTPVGEHEKEIWALALHPSGRYLAAGDMTGSIRIWALLPAPFLLNVFTGHQGALMDLNFSPDGRTLASASLDGTLRLWDVGTIEAPPPEPIVLRMGKLGQQSAVAFDPSGKWLASAAFGHPLVHLWPLSHEYARVLKGHTDATVGLQFSEDGHWLFSASEDGTVRRWPLDSTVPASSSAPLFQADNDLFYDLAYSSRRNALLLGSDRGEVRYLPLDGSPSSVLEGFDSAIEAVAFSRDGRWVAAGGGTMQMVDAVVRLWDLGTKEQTVLDSGARLAIYGLDFSPSARQLAVAEAEGVRLWDLETRTSSILQKGEFRSVQFSEDGSLLLMAGAEQVWIYSMNEGASRELAAHHGPSIRAAFRPSSNLVVSGDGDGLVRVGSLEGSEAHVLLGHTEAIRHVAISPDARWLASSSDDNTIRLWSVPHGKPFQELPLQDFVRKLESLTNLRVAPDERSLTGYRVDWPPSASWESSPSW